MSIYSVDGLTRSVSDGLHVARLQHGGVEELFITAVPGGKDGFHGMFESIMQTVRQADATIVGQDVFGIPALRRESHDALVDVCGDVDWPTTCLEEGASEGFALTGTHVHAISGASVERIHLRDRVVGSLFQNDLTRYCRLGDIRCDDTSLSREEQARQSFIDMETALGQVGMDFSHVIRTWLYLDDLLSWYDEFNVVRTDFFKERGVFASMVPASTGIGGSNHAGAAMVSDLLAVDPNGDSVKVFPVASPLQCPAIDYGSSFSRAVEIDAPDHRRLLISGTASIDPDGATLYVDDVAEQIRLTMDVVGAILDSRQMGWRDITRAIAYIKSGHDAEVYRKYCRDKGLPELPTVIAENDICRDDLLFEIEVDAIVV